ncbi:MAG: hypothetical protein LC664_08070 [Flavobacteriales bacterium]|nr:hypothetical protein [Flavobacteriales bacterium]
MDIVFNVNPLGLEGLAASLTSLVRNCSRSENIAFWILSSDLSDLDKKSITTLLETEHFKGSTEFVDFDAKKIFGHLRSLHGDWTSYGRLLIPDIVKSERALYLDADLVIELDVLRLEHFDFKGNLIGAVHGSEIKHTLDRAFLTQRLNLSEDTDYFNAGVLLLNLQKWRTERVEDEWNAHLPEEFNVPWRASTVKPENSNSAILHYVGSPKPWDWCGAYIHRGYKTWNSYTPAFWKKRYGKMNSDKIQRTWKIRRSLIKGFKHKATTS